MRSAVTAGVAVAVAAGVAEVSAGGAASRWQAAVMARAAARESVRRVWRMGGPAGWKGPSLAAARRAGSCRTGQFGGAAAVGVARRHVLAVVLANVLAIVVAVVA